jgi:putative two-component system response regulator
LTNLAKDACASAGYTVHSALHPKKAIDLYKIHDPDIAIVDVMMPDIDGFQLCQILKEMAGRSFFPVVLLTALNDRTSRITGLESGADDFMSKPFDSRELLAKMRSLLKLKFLYDELEHSENIILTLAVALEARDPYTRGHSARVGDISGAFGRHLSLAWSNQELLRKAGLLHDIGKIGISEGLLRKPAPLSEEEVNVIKQHPIVGEQICKPLQSLRGILPAVRHHHERWDGGGFPDGLKGEEIPHEARILAIVDSFDAMLSERPYRDGKSYSQVLHTMKDERSLGQWDFQLLDSFIEMVNLMGEDILSHYGFMN